MTPTPLLEASQPTLRDDGAAALLQALLGPLADRLREVSLPLHILAESRFGELNENQLEMLDSARAAADDGDALLRRVQRIVLLSTAPAGESTVTTRLVDLVRAPVALANARGAARGVSVAVDVAPDLPRIRGERAHLEEAFALLLDEAVRCAPDETRLALEGEKISGEWVELRIACGASAGGTIDLILAARLLQREGATLQAPPPRVVVRLRRD